MTRPIRFLLDGEVHAVSGAPVTRTLLEHLREDLGRTGTKEGCAEGDCGACTVVVADIDPADGRLRPRAINACIQFLPALHGKALFTVESLKDADGALHPVQQAMVDCHGAQCGFCTPGFVMSLFALYKTETAPDRARIDDALSGNLCRCTGYRPIVDAARGMYRLGAALPEARANWLAAPCGRAAAAAAAQGRGLAGRRRAVRGGGGVDKGEETFEYSADGARFFAPRTLRALAELRLAHPRARLLAGGTDVGLWVTKQYRELGDILLYTGDVAELRRITEADGALEIGAAATLADAFPAIVARHPEFAEVARRFASPPIRNAGTLGGNVANGSPIGDSMPCLIALGVRIVLRRGESVRELALEDFYLGYQKNALAEGEFVQALRVPPRCPELRFRAYKISKRFDQDISALLGAFSLEIEDGVIRAARVAFGGMAATPKRAPACETALTGRPWNEATLVAAQAALDSDYAPISDMRASDAYRRLTARNLLRRLWLETGIETPAGAAPAMVRVHEVAAGAGA